MQGEKRANLEKQPGCRHHGILQSPAKVQFRDCEQRPWQMNKDKLSWAGIISWEKGKSAQKAELKKYGSVS